MREVAELALAAPQAPEPRSATDLLLSALATRFTEGYTAAFAPLSSALRALGDDSRWLGLACRLAQDLWDDELWHVLAMRGVRVARETGALSTIPIAATYRAALHVHEGAFDSAAALNDEAETIAQATGIAPVKYGALILAAWHGDEAQASELFENGRQEATPRGEGMGLGVLGWATALLHNGGGRYDEALAAARQACEHDDVGAFAWALVEQIEAGVRVGEADLAAAAFEQLRERTQASGTEWALGIEAGSHALVSDAGSPSRSTGSR